MPDELYNDWLIEQGHGVLDINDSLLFFYFDIYDLNTFFGNGCGRFEESAIFIRESFGDSCYDETLGVPPIEGYNFLGNGYSNIIFE